VALGLAVSVKIWAVAPLAVIAGWQFVVAGPRRLGMLLSDTAAGAAVVCLPFLLLAPEAMVRMVVADQTGRPRMAVSTSTRLQSLLNDPLLGGLPRGETKRLIVVLALVLVAVVLAWTEPGARVFVLLLGATTAVLIASPGYFPHYGSFPAPFLALVVGVATAVAGTRLPRRAAAGSTVVVLLLVLVVVSAVTPLSRPMNDPFQEDPRSTHRGARRDDQRPPGGTARPPVSQG
jgi:hypothetical protein